MEYSSSSKNNTNKATEYFGDVFNCPRIACDNKENNDFNNSQLAEFSVIFLFVSHSIYPILFEFLSSSSSFVNVN